MIGRTNKKAFGFPQTIMIFIFVIVAVFVIILLGIYGLIFSTITNNLALDIDVGNANLGNATNTTLGQITNAYNSSVDTFGYVLIFGMIIFMFVTAYYTRDSNPRLMLIIEIFILIFAFILAVYMSNTYETLINSTSELNYFTNELANSSAFILNLPIYIGIIGAIIMIISYSTLPRDQNEPNLTEFE